jgi:hypothetical protein
MTTRNFFICTLLALLLFLPSALSARQRELHGIVMSVPDLETTDWPKLAAENGINTLGTHITPPQVLTFLKTERGKHFLQECRRLHISVEHQLHSMHDLLPRELFSKDSTLFRMNEEGRRSPDFNCCVSSKAALDTIAKYAVNYARQLPSTDHRYYFWMDDNASVCQCPRCSQYSPSEQALLIENHIIRALKKFDPKATLAHLAYMKTMEPPLRVKPDKAIFLEFAPVQRVVGRPLADSTAVCFDGKTHADLLRLLRKNLMVFPARTAVVLEYWLDVSLASKYQKPAVRVPWNKDVFTSDIRTYRSFGLRNFTTFGVYIDRDYFSRYPDTTFLKEYGAILNQHTPNKR